MEMAMAGLGILGTVLFVVVLFVGIFLTLIGLPGTVVILLDAVIYSAATGWKLPWWLLVILLGITVIAEVSDNVVSAAGVKRSGGSTKGMFAAVAGGLLGALIGAAILGALLPVIGGILGPILGGMAGGFAGGYWYELRQGRTAEEARKAGMGAMTGRVAGALCKTVSAVVMVVVVLMNAF